MTAAPQCGPHQGRLMGGAWGASHWARRPPPPSARVGIERGRWLRSEASGGEGGGCKGGGARRRGQGVAADSHRERGKGEGGAEEGKS